MSEQRQRVVVVTPEHVVYDADASFVVIPGTEGDLGVLPNHAPLITLLKSGVVRIRQGGRELKFVIAGGLLKVKDNQVIILTGAAEEPRDIDLARARAARERAERRLAAQSPDIDFNRARAALMRAAARLRADVPPNRR
ncbi:MAG: F0F1 ATP synthase subunit epsilon [Ammonifex sp.]|nr:MAG: F0F1 ATP synthase subunit epsilon [Ammonifex sp.]